MKINSWHRPFWNWIMTAAIMSVPTYIMYSVGSYIVPRGDYRGAIGATIYSLGLVWVAYMFAKRALSQSQLNKLEKLHLPKE